MSVVIAVKDKDRVVIGADKQASTGSFKDHTCIKIWEVPELPGAIMGGVGSARASQIIQCSRIIDKNSFDDEPTTEFIITTLAPIIAATLADAGFKFKADAEDTGCPMIPNAFIFAYKQNAWVIWNDLSVSEIDEYIAIGSGSDVAMGALFATPDKNPFARIVTCIDAAAESTLFVDDGVDVLCTEDRPDDEDEMTDALGLEMIALSEFESLLKQHLKSEESEAPKKPKKSKSVKKENKEPKVEKKVKKSKKEE